MKAIDVFPSTFLKKEDAAHPLQLVIANVAMEDVNGDDGKEKKAVMHFQYDKAKPMILNRGNWGLLEEAYGDDSDDWAGKPVEIYVDPSVMFAGKRVGGLRVRVPSGPVVWKTIDEAAAHAKAECEMSIDTLKANLKAAGIDRWHPEKCTPIVKQMIEEAKAAPF